MMKCPQCHNSLEDVASVCAACGFNILPETQASAPPADDLANAPTRIADAAGKTVSSPPDDPLIGQILDSKYQIIDRLGSGGMGTVYRARRVHIGDEVVVKVLHQNFVAEAATVERFRREARSAAMLNHPNIVTIHDFGEARGASAPAYIVMELVEGLSLRELLKREGRLQPARVISLMRGICAGVGAAHRRHVIHRDLKPDNIIVLPPDDGDEQERVKVVDFGIAKLRDMAAAALTLTETGIIMGTPYYMSPEQCRGDSLDPRSDVYSLGVMLYEMLAGKPPFTSRTPTGLIAKHLTEAPPPLPPELNLPRTLEAVCLRTLAKDPDMRQADATVLARELQTVAEYQRQETGDLPRKESQRQPEPQVTESQRITNEVAQEQRQTASRQPAIETSYTPEPPPPSNHYSNPLLWTVGGVIVLLAVLMLVTRHNSPSSESNVQQTSAPPSSSSVSDANKNQAVGPSLAPTATASSTPQPAPVKVHLQLLYVGATRFYSVADNIPVTLISKDQTITQLTDSDGVATFDKAPCDQHIEFTFKRDDGKLQNIPTNLNCEWPVIDMGMYSMMTGDSLPSSVKSQIMNH